MTKTKLFLGLAAIVVLFFTHYFTLVIGSLDKTDVELSEASKLLYDAADKQEALLRSIPVEAAREKIISGNYIYEITDNNGVKRSLNASIKVIENEYYLKFAESDKETLISTDGGLFIWSGNGYGYDRHLGRLDGSTITGYTYYLHGTDVGVESFTIRLK